jgi:predicted HicB family RNase H-like nuclease
MNLTLSVDDKLVEKARQVASRQGTSLQALVRQYIETLAGSREGAPLVERLEEH